MHSFRRYGLIRIFQINLGYFRFKMLSIYFYSSGCFLHLIDFKNVTILYTF